MKNQKFVLYAQCADDEGGYGTCLAEKFTSNIGYNPKSGWRAKPSIEIGRFNTVEELAALFCNDSEYYTPETAMDEANFFFDRMEDDDD